MAKKLIWLQFTCSFPTLINLVEALSSFVVSSSFVKFRLICIKIVLFLSAAANVVKLVAGGKNAIFHVNVERDIRAMMTLENVSAEMKLFVIQLVGISHTVVL